MNFASVYLDTYSTKSPEKDEEGGREEVKRRANNKNIRLYI